jgi:hypothetical protein
MLDGNRCELCRSVVERRKSKYKQTKYCEQCAKAKKRENSLNPWLPDEKRHYMREYMRRYRLVHPRLSSRYVRRHRKNQELQDSSPIYKSTQHLRSVNWFLPFFFLIVCPELMDSFKLIEAAITYLEVLTIKITGLAIIGVFCWRHLTGLKRRTLTRE